jgi:Insertion element 4 transposase N-terminal/Transposase DDE domain
LPDAGEAIVGEGCDGGKGGPEREPEALALRLGVLTREIGPELVDAVVEAAGRRERRRRLLPAATVVYFVLGLCLFSGADSMVPPGYRSVMRWLSNGLRHLHADAPASSSALTKARQRLGAQPLELLFGRLRGPLGKADTPGVFAFGLRLVSWDGTGLDLADTPGNEEAFGRLQGGSPQIRLLTLIECGTHAVIDAAFAGICVASEHKLARQVLCSLQAGMLLMGDRNFPGHELWGLATDTGADLLWRIKKNIIFVPITVLPDGSFTSIMPTPADGILQAKALAQGKVASRPPTGHLVRIIEYDVTVHGGDGSSRTEPFRLVTTILDHTLAPAASLAALYHQRWEIENSYQELKTRLRGAEFILRSKSPELVRQELYAFLAVYQALCSLRAEAATTAGLDPDRISFTVTVRIARTEVTNQAAATPATLRHSRTQAIRDLLADRLPPRRPRQYERIRKAPKSNYTIKKHDHVRIASHATYKITMTRKPLLPAPMP